MAKKDKAENLPEGVEELMPQGQESVDGSTAAPTAKEKKVKEPKAPKASVGYKFLREIDGAKDKFNNQQQVLINAALKLADADGVVSREAWLNEVTPEALKSRQSTEAVLGFYLTSWRKGKVNEKDESKSVAPLFETVALKPAA